MLTTEQIQYLYRFCEKKSVRHYDLQEELVDHLSAAIEEKMRLNPLLNFEQALQEVYSGFGIFGFAHIVAGRERAMNKEYRLQNWRHFKAYFTWPGIGVSLLLFLLINTPAFYLRAGKLSTYYIIVFLLVVPFTLLVLLRNREIYKKPSKNFLALSNQHSMFGIIAIMLQVPNIIFNIIRVIPFDTSKVWVNVGLSLLWIGIVFLTLAKLETDKKNYYQLKNRYPTAFE